MQPLFHVATSQAKSVSKVSPKTVNLSKPRVKRPSDSLPSQVVSEFSLMYRIVYPVKCVLFKHLFLLFHKT